MDNRIQKACPKCRHSWLLEPVKPEWQGTSEGLKKYRREHSREFNYCYCGQDLYKGK